MANDKTTGKGWLMALVVGGGLSAILWLTGPRWAFWVVLVIAILWFIGCFAPPDVDYDALLEEKRKQLRERAKRKLGLEDEEISIADPIELAGFNIGERVLHDSVIDKAENVQDSKTKRWRGPEAILTGYYFTENHLAFYQWRVSLVSDSQREFTDEVFYQDIVSLKTDEQESVRITSPEDKEGTHVRETVFVVTNRGGEHLFGFGPADQLESAQRAMRALLREKKR